MPSSFSTSLRLELQADGENSGTWGQKTNVNLGTLLEQAIAGYTSVNVGGGVDVTLTASNGVADQARNAVIKLTGALTANINLIVPTAAKSWIFDNQTSGAFSVTAKTAAGTGVALLQGAKSQVYCDGANVLAGANVMAGGFLTGNTTVAGTLVGATLTSPIIATIQPVAGQTLTLPSTTDTLVGRASADTLANKTLTSPAINGGTISGTWAGNATFSGNLTYSGSATFQGPTAGTPKTAGIPSSGTWAPDFSAGNNFATPTLTGNLTIQNPTGALAGQSGVIEVNGAGSFTTDWGANFHWPNGVKPAASGGLDIYSWYARSSSYIVIAQSRAVA